MGRSLRHRPSPAMVVACLALAVALTGTSYAAIRLPANSVGTKQLKKNAVTSAKVKNNAITGGDVNEASLGQVPAAAGAKSAANASHATNADHATSADSATNANHAGSADSATSAGTANAAFSTYHDALIVLPDSLGAIATLDIPTAGNYVVSAKLDALNTLATASDVDECVLGAGAPDTAFDTTVFDVDGALADDDEVVVLQGVRQFAAGGKVVLLCTDLGLGSVDARNVKITAVQVAHLTNTGF
jgi:hypothetical protein